MRGALRSFIQQCPTKRIFLNLCSIYSFNMSNNFWYIHSSFLVGRRKIGSVLPGVMCPRKREKGKGECNMLSLTLLFWSLWGASPKPEPLSSQNFTAWIHFPIVANTPIIDTQVLESRYLFFCKVQSKEYGQLSFSFRIPMGSGGSLLDWNCGIWGKIQLMCQSLVSL